MKTPADFDKEGIAKAEQQDFEGAITYFNHAIELQPDHAPSFVLRGDARSARKDYDGAIADYTRAAQLKPDYAHAFYNRAWAKDLKRDYDGAITDYDRVIALRPDDAAAFGRRAIAKRNKKDLAGAIADYDRAIELKPGSAETFNLRGVAKRLNQDPDGAIADYDRAIELKPGQVEAYDNRAVAKRFKGDYDGAIADYERVIKLKPESSHAFFGRGVARMAKRDFVEALADFDHALNLAPESSYGRLQQHLLLVGLGRDQEDDLADQVAGWKDGWPKTIGLFLIGKITKPEFQRQASAGDNPETRKRRCGEMNYYVGMVDLLAGRVDAAADEFEACVQAGATGSMEFTLARVELAHLEKGGAPVDPEPEARPAEPRAAAAPALPERTPAVASSPEPREAGAPATPEQPSPPAGMTSPLAELARARCCIVGGGPAGMMLGYLMARAGIDTLVLEKHADFLRDFRGDTVHPSTLTLLDELGLLEEFLQRPHQKLARIGADFGGRRVEIADFSRLKVKCPYIAFMPQWDFLNFLAEKCRAFPHFRLAMETEAVDLLVDGGRITGVRATTKQGQIEVAAHLTVGCDGRHSLVRGRAGLAVKDLGAPIDVLWFRVSRAAGEFDQTFGHFEPGHILITLDRGDYWQCAYVIPKGRAEEVKKQGLEEFRRRVAATAPALQANVGDIKDWDDVKLLTVAVDRLTRWTRPGLLCIGDAAHAMSPVGGVGINLAIQDAVAAANALAGKLRHQDLTEEDLAAVQRRRLFPTKAIQAVQIMIQNRLLAPVISAQGQPVKPPLALRLVNAVPALRRVPAWLVGIGVRPEHIRSPRGA